ncbi:MAG: hypothetical protein ACQESE_04880 [Nanobdellota archaeon]
MKFIATILTMFLLVASFAAAAPQDELPDAGMTPDSPFYFMDRAFDVFKSPEARADERVAEAIVMAQQGNEKGLEKAMNGYEKAMQKREKRSQGNEEEAVETAEQAGRHAQIFANVSENVPEQTRNRVREAISKSDSSMNRALGSLNEMNTQRAQETLQGLIGRMPEEANVSHALEMVQMNRSALRGDSNKTTSENGMNNTAPQQRLLDDETAEQPNDSTEKQGGNPIN